MERNGSKRTWVAVVFVLSSTACGYGGDRANPEIGSECGELRQAVIDPAGRLDVPAGSGAGALIEYDSGGKWKVRTLCDTNRTGQSCSWDILFTPRGGASILSFRSEEFEGDDWIGWEGDTALRYITRTRGDFDVALFEATPGGTVRIDVLLGGFCAHPYLFWVSGGAYHPGAPSNPIDMTPSSP